MTPAERAFWLRFNRKASALSPEIAAALLRAWRTIRAEMSDAEIERAIRTGTIEQLFESALSDAVLEISLAPVRDRIRRSVNEGVKFARKELPPSAAPPGAAGSVTFAFDILNPAVIDAVRTLETRMIRTLKSDIRDTVRAHVENGLAAGVNPRKVAKSLRTVIGLAPNQERAVHNFERALRGDTGASNPLSYKLRDRRFDSTVRKGELSDSQVEKMVSAYRKRFVSWNAETNARTAALDSMRLGQRLSIEQAIDMGVYERSRLMKRWRGVMDDRERPEHVEMEGEAVRYDEPFSNGEMTPGESTYNCRCVAVYYQARAA